MAKRRRLNDLYIVGKEVTVDDGSGDPITVYLRKINQVDQEEAVRRSNAARSKILASQKSPDDLFCESLRYQVQALDRDTILDNLAATQVIDQIASIESEVAHEDEWAKDEYLQGLQDAWADGTMAKYVEHPEDEEAKHVFDELTRYNTLVQERVLKVQADTKESFDERDDVSLQELMLKDLLEREGEAAWVKEFRKCQVWLATHDNPRAKERYFTSRKELDDLDVKVYEQLLVAYRDMEVEADQGKSLPPTPDSSLPSNSPEEVEVAPSSGLTAVPV